MFNYEIISLFAPIENGCVRYYIMKTAVEKHDNDIQKSFKKKYENLWYFKDKQNNPGNHSSSL